MKFPVKTGNLSRGNDYVIYTSWKKSFFLFIIIYWQGTRLKLPCFWTAIKAMSHEGHILVFFWGFLILIRKTHTADRLSDLEENRRVKSSLPGFQRRSGFWRTLWRVWPHQCFPQQFMTSGNPFFWPRFDLWRAIRPQNGERYEAQEKESGFSSRMKSLAREAATDFEVLRPAYDLRGGWPHVLPNGHSLSDNLFFGKKLPICMPYLVGKLWLSSIDPRCQNIG